MKNQNVDRNCNAAFGNSYEYLLRTEAVHRGVFPTPAPNNLGHCLKYKYKQI